VVDIRPQLQHHAIQVAPLSPAQAVSTDASRA
jgi:hypothetical protein